MPTTISRNEWKPIHAGMLIGGEWTSGAQRLEIFNPARTDELVGTVPAEISVVPDAFTLLVPSAFAGINDGA